MAGQILTQKSQRKKELKPMSKRKAYFTTTIIMSLLTTILFFIWRFSNAFGIPEAMFALYGYIRFTSDLSRWLQMPDAEMLRRGRRQQW
jgi:hypothetical protein